MYQPYFDYDLDLRSSLNDTTSFTW